MNVVDKIRSQREDWEESFEVVDGYWINMPDLLKKIELYSSSRFVGGEKDEDGFKRLFINIINHRVDTATKQIDLDQKHVRVHPQDFASPWPAWFIKRELGDFMRDEGFNAFFNQVSEKLPKYGTVVIKNVAGSPKVVSAHNIRCDKTVDCITRSTWTHEDHEWSIDEYKDLANEKGWDDTDNVIKMHLDQGLSTIRGVEAYGYFDNKDLGVDGDGMTRGKVIIVGMDDDRDKENKLSPMTVHTSETDEKVYMDIHWLSIDGRYWGVGIPEAMFVNQEYFNDVTHMERRALFWESLKLWQTRDSNAPKNLFTEVKNGTVFNKVKDEIKPVSMGERSTGQYHTIYDRIEKNSDQRTFTFEVNTGETLPSGTPFRLGALLLGSTNTFFDFKREKIGIVYEDMLNKFVIPSFKSNKRKAHLLNFNKDSDIMNFVNLAVNTLIQKEIEKFEKKNGRLPTISQVEQEKQKVIEKITSGDNMQLELPEGFYKDAKAKIRIDITGESTDTSTEITTLTSLLQTIGSNPAITQDPTSKRIIELIISRTSFHPGDVIEQGQPAQGQPTQGQPIQGTQGPAQPIPNQAPDLAPQQI